ncbi:uncharacterized protein LOC132407242 [Hypanus sabinus]|uniref:uncharacterized protein LOC132407242 n=1 Tax=Hypanus sabinus TaxID=79690 RepID=UPI0028C3CB3F|nr:uncharacterized protein LOC132407242 [Hypanus sabinus]
MKGSRDEEWESVPALGVKAMYQFATMVKAKPDTSNMANVLVIMDHYIRYAQAFLTKDQRAFTVAKVLWEKLSRSWRYLFVRVEASCSAGSASLGRVRAAFHPLLLKRLRPLTDGRGRPDAPAGSSASPSPWQRHPAAPVPVNGRRREEWTLTAGTPSLHVPMAMDSPQLSISAAPAIQGILKIRTPVPSPRVPMAMDSPQLSISAAPATQGILKIQTPAPSTWVPMTMDSFKVIAQPPTATPALNSRPGLHML